MRHLLKMFPHYFSGNQLSRFSERRNKYEWLTKIFDSPESNIAILRNSEPLFKSCKSSVDWRTSEEIKQLFPDILVSSSISKDSSVQKVPPIVFLGLDSTISDNSQAPKAYWAIQLTHRKESIQKVELLTKKLEQNGSEFVRFRPTVFNLNASEAAMIAQARALLDWNSKSTFCSACGSETISREAGYKRVCLSSLDPTDSKACSTGGPPMNYMHPRTDPVTIVCVISADGKSCLLGRKPGWPHNTYSCVAGFLEPGESLEEAAMREVFEETGVHISEVKYHSSQPWPFPNSLMVGCIAKATTSTIQGADEELEDAKWFSKEVVLEALKNERFRSFDFSAPAPSNSADLVLPPAASIAHQLIKAWAEQNLVTANL